MTVRDAPAQARALLKQPDLLQILTLLDCDGEEARLVGGALRNALLGFPVREFDIATTAAPEAVIARAQAAGLRTVPTGLTHGTVTLLVETRAFEVTSLREDVDTDGRHATVRFSRDFEADAQRRDFTMNALSMTRDGRLYDYVGGLADIAAHKLRFIGDPAARIREDYLRILRFFRFAADYAEGPLDAAAVLACMRARDGLARLSRERVRSEIMKLLAARRAGDVAREFCQTGLLGPLLAAAPNPARLENLLRYHCAGPRDPVLNLAALCVNVPEDAYRLRDRLRLSNPEHQRLCKAAEALLPLHALTKPPPAPDMLRLVFRYGRQAACDALALAQAENGLGVAEAWHEAITTTRTAQEPRLPFSGDDLLARGIPDGKPIGDALKALRRLWVEAGFPDEPERLAAMLEAVIKTAGKE